MLGTRLSVQDKLLVAALALSGLVFALSVVCCGSYVPAAGPAYGDDATTEEEQVYTIGGEGGEVSINGNVVLRLRVGAGGFTAEERALIIRQRLSDLVAVGIEPSDVHAGMVRGQWVVLAGDSLIITADAEHARGNDMCTAYLAEIWACNIAAALGGEPGPPSATIAGSWPGGRPTYAWRPSEPYKDKEVPVISIGRGIRVGMARVTGPTSKVNTVKAVAQLESRLQKFGDVEIYVPISTETPGESLDRVNECAVVGLADLQL